MIRRALLISLLYLSANVAAEQATSLDTQYGDTVHFPVAGIAQVLIYSDRAGSRHTQPWRELTANGDCMVIEAANLSSAPRVARPFVRRAFNDAPPILMDWQGELAERYGFVDNSANIYVLTHEGELAAHFHGLPDERSQADFAQVLQEHCHAVD